MKMCCCPSNKVIKSYKRSFLALGGLHDDKLCDTLQAMAPTNVKTVYQTSFLHIESNLDRLGLLLPTIPTATVLSNKADKSRPNQFTSTTAIFSTPHIIQK